MSATSLTRARDFRRIQSTGRRARSNGVAVAALPGADARGPSRMGLAVGRRVGGAVVRNRVKRRLRHVVRGHLAALPRGSRLVVRALPDSAEAASHELDRDLSSALDRALGRALDRTPERTPAGRGRRSS